MSYAHPTACSICIFLSTFAYGACASPVVEREHDIFAVRVEVPVGGDIDTVAGIKLIYAVRLEPDFRGAPLLASVIMRRDVGRQVDGVVGEMLKRYAAARGATAPRTAPAMAAP